MVGPAPRRRYSCQSRASPVVLAISRRYYGPGLPAEEIYPRASRVRGYSQALQGWEPLPVFEKPALMYEPWRLVAVPPDFETMIDSWLNLCHAMRWHVRYPQNAQKLFCVFVVAVLKSTGYFMRIPDVSRIWSALPIPIQMAWGIASASVKEKYRGRFLGLAYQTAAFPMRPVSSVPWAPLPHLRSPVQPQPPLQPQIQYQTVQENEINQEVLSAYRVAEEQTTQAQINQERWPAAYTYEPSIPSAMELSPLCPSIYMASPDTEWQALPSGGHANGELIYSSVTTLRNSRPTTKRAPSRRPRHKIGRRDIEAANDSDDDNNDSDSGSKENSRRTDTPRPVLRSLHVNYDELLSEPESGEERSPPPLQEEDKHRRKRIKSEVTNSERRWGLAGPIPPPPYAEVSPLASSSRPSRVAKKKATSSSALFKRDHFEPDSSDDPEGL